MNENLMFADMFFTRSMAIPNRTKETAVLGAIGIKVGLILPRTVNPGIYEIKPKAAIVITTIEE
jgi:hypothetical protein